MDSFTDTAQAALPAPESAALLHSERLRERILAVIDADGPIGFSRFMQMALYEPGLGYYSAGATKFGSGGDFITAADLGDFLARTIVATILPQLSRAQRPAVVELGAGTGAMAADILERLNALGYREVDYRILEPSAQLRARQAEALAKFGDRVSWIEQLEPGSVTGAIVANEVADALPVDRIMLTLEGWVQLAVIRKGRAFGWVAQPLPAPARALVETLTAELPEPLPPGYVTEIRPLLDGWVGMLCEALADGVALISDYGMSRREYFHPQRESGTLMCHYRHRAHADPFLYPGLQDITAWVDFSSCARAGVDAGAEVAGYTTQGSWIAETLLTDSSSLPALDAVDAARLKTLLLPGEMGERFKVLMLGRGSEQARAARLRGRDMRDRL